MFIEWKINLWKERVYFMIVFKEVLYKGKCFVLIYVYDLGYCEIWLIDYVFKVEFVWLDEIE